VCNSTANYWDRATALVDLFTVEELVANMGNNAAGVSRLGLAPYNWWNEALHGVAKGHGVTFGNPGEEFSVATSFPQVIGLGATFDVCANSVFACASLMRVNRILWFTKLRPLLAQRRGRLLTRSAVASTTGHRCACHVRAASVKLLTLSKLHPEY